MVSGCFWHLASCEGSVCPWETLPGPDDPFLFTFCALSNGPRASCCFCSASFAYCTLARKVPGGSSGGTSSGPAVLFPVARAPLGPPPICWECQLPPCWVDSWCHSEPLVPSGKKIFNATHGDTFGMLDPAGTAGSSHRRVVCLGGITG